MTPTVREWANRAARLRREHDRLDAQCSELCARARNGSWEDVDQVWDRFAANLADHFSFEEKEVFSRFARSEADGERLVAELTSQHAEIKRQLEKMGVDIQIHAIRSKAVDALVASIHQHKELEDARLYPWLERQVRAFDAPERRTARR